MAFSLFGKKKNKEKGQAEPAAPKKPVRKTPGSSLPGISLQLLMTEKGVGLQENNVVTFRVARGATKSKIARAVEARYKVVPEKIRTVTVLPKKRRRGNTAGKTASWKKAYVVVNDIHHFNLGA